MRDLYELNSQTINNNSLVNLILKPIFQANSLIDLGYYIFRGILKDGLINGSEIASEASDNNELIQRIYENEPDNKSAKIIGYDETLNSSVEIESTFTDFTSDLKSIFVKEGEWIGTFTKDSKIGFEIILTSNRFTVDLGHLRKEKHQIDINGFTGFAERMKREEILNFIDPAAFFGLHAEKDIEYTNYSPNKVVKKSSSSSIFNIFLENKFDTANRVYFDIRSEKGYSYNLYDNYDDGSGNSLRFKLVDESQQSGTTTPSLTSYESYGWPIVSTETAQNTSNNENSVYLSLRIDDNLKPIIYISNDFFKDDNDNSNYIKGNKINTDSSGEITLTDWSKEIQFNFRNIGGASPKLNVANYIQFYYFRQEHNKSLPNTIHSPNTVLLNQKYYDSAFCSIDIPNLGSANVIDKAAKNPHPIYVREELNTDGTGNFGLTMNNGAYWDDQRILFYATINYEYTAKTSEKEYINTFEQKLDLDSNDYRESQLRNRTEITCREYVNGPENIKIPSINFYRSLGTKNADVSANHKENAMLLGLTLDELEAIKTATSLNAFHHRYIHLEADSNNPLVDTGSNRYYKYTLKLQGMLLVQNNPIVVDVEPNGSPIDVYSRDNQFFCSKAFSDNEPLTTGQNGQNQDNQIEFHIYHDGVVKINDNIDLALVYDSQRIHYKYHAENNVITDICDLELVMANKMRRKTYDVGPPRINDFPISQFPPLDTLTFIRDYELEGVDLETSNGVTYSGVDAGRTYSNGRGDILVRPRQSNPGYSGFRWYRNQKFEYPYQQAKCFMVKLVTSIVRNQPPIDNNYITSIVFSNDTPSIDLQYENTLRLFANPSLAAAMIGALIEFNNQVTCQGFAYDDASCYPSAEHINGEAADTDYHSTTELNVEYIQALRLFGFKLFRIGNSSHSTSNSIYNDPTFADVRETIFDRDSAGSTLHQSHLHSTNVKLKDGNKVL